MFGNIKMLRNNFVVFLILLVSCKALESNEVSLENVIKQILNISPPEIPVGKFHEDQQPPKHMLELYHRFTSGRRASGETVRSITPNSASPPSAPTHSVLFNISLGRGAGEDEEVRLAQLVLRRRRLARHPHPLHRKLLAPPCRVRLYQLVASQGRVRTVPLASIPVPQVSRGGWHSLDITSAVRELLLSSPGSSNYHTLGVRFEAPRSKVIPPSHFLDQRDNTSAFLMLFSEESSDNDIPQNNKKQPTISREHIELIALHVKNNEHDKKRHHHVKESENPRRHKNKEKEDEEDTDIQELINMNQVKKLKRHKKLFDDFDVKYDDERESEGRIKIKSNLIDELLENSETRRVIRSVDTPNRSHKRRSIYDNELPYEKLHIKDTSKTLTTTNPPEVVTEFEAAEEEGDKNLIPYPPGMERKKKKRRRGKKRSHKSKVAKIPDEWNKEDRERHRRLHGARSENSSSNQTCAKRHLVVNFKDLGWSDWIIEPKLFNAHFCAGSCNFPVPESVPVTNHAIIQSLVHDHGLHKGVPAPCCVPHSMSPLTILYLVDDHHVILKNYRSMTVETCGCR